MALLKAAGPAIAEKTALQPVASAIFRVPKLSLFLEFCLFEHPSLIAKMQHVFQQSARLSSVSASPLGRLALPLMRPLPPRPNAAGAHFQLLRRNMAKALFDQKLRNGRYVSLHMDLHGYLPDSIP